MGTPSLIQDKRLGTKGLPKVIDYIHSRMFVKYEPTGKQNNRWHARRNWRLWKRANGCSMPGGRFPATGRDAHVACRNRRRRGRDSRRGLLAFQGQGRAVPRHVRPRDAAAGRAVRARRRNRLDRPAGDAARALRGRAATPRRRRAHAGGLRGDLPQDRDWWTNSPHRGVARRPSGAIAWTRSRPSSRGAPRMGELPHGHRYARSPRRGSTP